MDPPSVSTILLSPVTYEDDWKSSGTLDQLILKKDSSPIIEARSTIHLLNKLYHQNNEISMLVYQREMENQFQLVSAFVESKIDNEKQALDVIEMILTKQHQSTIAASTTTSSSSCCSFSCCLKYLYISAILATILVLVAIIIDQVQNLPKYVSIILFYILAIVVLIVAYFMQRSSSSSSSPISSSLSFTNFTQIISIIGVSLLSTAYHYSLKNNNYELEPPIYYILDVISWSVFAFHFQSKTMGFISIGFLLFLSRLHSVEMLFLTSILLVSLHILFKIQFQNWLIYNYTRVLFYYTLVEVGILYLATFCLFVTLLILSLTTKVPFTWMEWTFFNFLSIVISVLFVYLGWTFSSLYMLRGIACIFGTIYITSKWYDIQMGSSAYYFQQLGGCILLLIMILQLKARPYLFLPHHEDSRTPVENVELSNCLEEVETSVSVMDNNHPKELKQEKINMIL